MKIKTMRKKVKSLLKNNSLTKGQKEFCIDFLTNPNEPIEEQISIVLQFLDAADRGLIP
jgi:hypothetical protein